MKIPTKLPKEGLRIDIFISGLNRIGRPNLFRFAGYDRGFLKLYPEKIEIGVFKPEFIIKYSDIKEIDYKRYMLEFTKNITIRLKNDRFFSEAFENIKIYTFNKDKTKAILLFFKNKNVVLTDNALNFIS